MISWGLNQPTGSLVSTTGASHSVGLMGFTGFYKQYTVYKQYCTSTRIIKRYMMYTQYKVTTSRRIIDKS